MELMAEERKGNRLVGERSPYLLQHAYNPVDWYPWGEEAFAAAIDLDRPIFLSIGYSSCHWCHVMERESFEDLDVARLMNETFVNIKVDREERPDVDSLYMKVCQMMTGGGGWPLTIIMTPDRVPFWTGTYLPRFSKQGMTGMLELVPAVNKVWREERDDIKDVTVKVLEMLDSFERDPEEGDVSMLPLLALERLKEDYEPKYGGFDGERKFPSPHKLIFLMRYWREHHDQVALDMVIKTLDNMIKGGIRDHVGGGFHRYSTDPRWHLPHFEKMLYDQALILMALAEAYAITSKQEYRQAAEELIVYVEKRLTSPEGGFFSSEDADADGEEGSTYLWTYDELSSLLSAEDMVIFKELYGIWDSGNYRDEGTRMRSGKNVLHLTSFVAEHATKKGMDPVTLMAWDVDLRETMRSKRDQRPDPALDDKILTDWNGLMIVALCKAHRYLGSERAFRMAKQALTFLEERMVVDGELYHNSRIGHMGALSFLDDHACLAWAHLEMYFLTHEAKQLERVLVLTEQMINLFTDKEEGGLFMSREDPLLLVRIKDLYDGAAPSGNSIAYYILVQLAAMFNDARIVSVVEGSERHFLKELRVVPSSYAMFINGVLMKEMSKTLEIFGPGNFHIEGYHPHLLTTMAEHLEKGAVRQRPSYRLCLKGTCLPETEDLTEIKRMLK
ncbi:MAG TPA: thioredoxin domain-containing protein [Methanomassiliicoccales archaeon]|nr:thioredoxin domain-containing protein [Methanomassiliicoccales archaeon]